jgi:uncharacterized protein Veg
MLFSTGAYVSVDGSTENTSFGSGLKLVPVVGGNNVGSLRGVDKSLRDLCIKVKELFVFRMESVLANSVLIENSLRELIGMRVTMTVAETKKRTVYREGLVYAYDSDTWFVYDDNSAETFEMTFEDFLTNKIFVHLE